MALNSDKVTEACCNYYKAQSGGGLNIFHHVPRGSSVQVGSGLIGNLLGRVGSFLLPLATKALPILGNIAHTFLGNLGSGGNLHDSGRAALNRGAQDVVQAGQEALSKYKRPRAAPRKRRKRARSSQRGNF